MPSDSLHSNMSGENSAPSRIAKFDKSVHSDKPTFKSQYSLGSRENEVDSDSNSINRPHRVRKDSLHSIYRSLSQSSNNTPPAAGSNVTTSTSDNTNNNTSNTTTTNTSTNTAKRRMKKSSQNLLKKTFSSLSINTNNTSDPNISLNQDTDFIGNNNYTATTQQQQTNARGYPHLTHGTTNINPNTETHRHHSGLVHIPPRKTSFAGSILKRLSGNSSSSHNNNNNNNTSNNGNSHKNKKDRKKSNEKILGPHMSSAGNKARNSVILNPKLNKSIPETIGSMSDSTTTTTATTTNPMGTTTSLSNRRPSMVSLSQIANEGPMRRFDSSNKTSEDNPLTTILSTNETSSASPRTTAPISTIPGLFPLDTNLDDLTDITKTVLPANQDLPKEEKPPITKEETRIIPPKVASISPMTVTKNESNTSDIVSPANITKAILKRSSIGNEQHSNQNKNIGESNIITTTTTNNNNGGRVVSGPKKSHSVGDFPAWSMTKSNSDINVRNLSHNTIETTGINSGTNLTSSKESSNTKLNKENQWVAPESWDVDPVIDREKQKMKKKLRRKLRKQRRKLLLKQKNKSSTSMDSSKLSSSLLTELSTSSDSDSDSDFSSDSSDSTSSSETPSSSEEYYGIMENNINVGDEEGINININNEQRRKSSKYAWDSSKDNMTSNTISSVNVVGDENDNNLTTALPSQAPVNNNMVNPPTLTTLEDERIDKVERELEHYYKDSSDLDSKKHYAVRIFNVDDTFTTLSCTPGTTVEDMIPTLKKKFNITQKSNYQISLKVGKLSKILRPTSKPIVIERKLLLLNGYRKTDPLHIIGIEDLSFVFKFLFHPVIPSHFTPEQEQRLLRSDFVHVDLRNMDLTTPPIIFYQHTSEIESLDVSNNANIFLPLEFIESSIKLMSLRMVNVRASRFPVNVTEAYKLVSLELQRNFIKKVPKTISKLGNLTILNLQCNELDKLPSSFGLLKNLQLLDLSSNKFTSYPDVINNCTNLLQIDLSYNKIHNIPNSINQLNKLAKINLSHNKLVEIESLSDMKNLRTLNLRYNRITAVHTVAPNLQNLFLTDNRISNFKDTLPKLRTLELQENPITSISFKDFYPLNMTSLILSKAQLSSIPGELFTELSRLEKLELSENNLSSLPKEIGSLNKLIYLSVARNKLESLPTEFSQLKSLRSLDLHYNNIRDLFDGIGEIELNYLNISSNAFGSSSLDSSTLPHIANGDKLANSLLFLVTADNQFDDSMWSFFNNFVNLKLLNLSYNNFTDISALQLDNLTELYMSGNKLNTIPSEIVLKWKELKVLMLNGNQLLTLPAELSQLSQLTTFDLGSNQLKYNISNYHYDWNWRMNKELKYLNFSANRKFEIRSFIDHETGDDFSDLTVLPQLKVLGLMDVTLNTSKVPDENSNFRLRTTASIINGMRYGVADSLGQRDHVSTRDVTFERFRGNDDECLICIHDSKNQNSDYGHNVSRIVRDIYDKILLRQLEKYGDSTDDEIKKALRFSFLQLNKEINGMLNSVDNGASVENLTSADLLSGACSTVVYIKKDKIFTANLGDCMTILCKNNGDFQTLTKQHLPTKREEYERIRISGGYVNNGKLDGVADVSRAVGFFDLLPHIHASPDISLTTLSATDDMLIIATHKLWEYLDIEMACDIAREHSAQPMIAAEAMKDHAIAYGCVENITIICLSLHTSTEQENQFTLNKNALLTRRTTFEDTALRRLQPEIAPPTGNLAVVFTDIKNSTFLWELFPNAMRTAIKTHNDLMRRQLRIFGGYEVKTEGDAFMVTFPTPTSAMAWCLNVQLKLLDVQWPEEITSIQDGGLVTDSNGVKIYQGLSVRMGMHWGHPVTELDLVTQRMDYLGPVVNKASRVSSVADGGQITLSNDFISEFNKIMKYHKMVTEEGKALEEVYGEEIVGEVLEREIAMLESIGWVFFDYGEQKLKGLETKEFITIVYPKILASRHEFSEKDNESKTIDEDLLFRLRTTSNRLEAILSAVSGGSLELENPKSSYRALSDDAKTALVKSVTERELMAFFDHLVTRVESAVVLLQLRQKTQNGLNIYGKSERNGSQQTIFEILDELLASFKQIKD